MRFPFKTRIVVALAAGAMASCATNPVTGQRQLSLISESDEIAMGRQAAQEVEQTIGLVDNAGLQAYVKRVAMPMAQASERPNLPWTFAVVDDPTPNAFALPGGFVYVTRGMTTLMRSEAELASVLGHEIGHVTARHSVTAISHQQLAQLGLGIGGLLSSQVQRFGGLLGTGMGLLFLQNSRDAERQADDIGFRYALNRDYAMSEMADVFRSLERLDAAQSSALPAFLSTHPSPGARVETIDAKVAALPSGSRGTIVREAEYLHQIDGMVYGEDPRQGFFRDGEFVHPDLRFRFAFPRGWKGQNLKQAVVGVSPQQDAALQLTIVNGRSPEAAARQFSSQSGVVLTDATSQAINGLPAVTGYFEASTDSGSVAGIIAWLSYEGRTYQLLTYASEASVSRQDSVFRQIVRSFGPLRDESALNARPNRINIITVPDRLTLAELNRRMPSAVPVEELAVINDVASASTALAPGRLVKRVVSGQAASRAR
jgi:predicted Zn-dependent protease